MFRLGASAVGYGQRDIHGDINADHCQFDSTGMFHWCPPQSLSACVIVRHLNNYQLNTCAKSTLLLNKNNSFMLRQANYLGIYLYLIMWKILPPYVYRHRTRA